MEQHVRLLAILNIVWGGLGVLIALFVLVFFGGLAGLVSTHAEPDSEVGAAVLGLIGGVAFLVVAILSAPSLVAGIGLLNFRSWAQPLTIIVSVLNLFSLPFGTALGIYGLWVLFSDEAKALIKARNPA
jgi:hypothetical protein